VLLAGLRKKCGGSRFIVCASALAAINAAAAQVMTGNRSAAMGGVESDVAHGLGSDSGVVPRIFGVAYQTYFEPKVLAEI